MSASAVRVPKLADYCQGTIGAADFAVLEEQLRSSPEARARFRSYLHLDAELRQFAERDPVVEQAWAPLARVPRAVPKIVRPAWGRATPWLALAAAVVLLAALGWQFLPRVKPLGAVVATLTRSSGAELFFIDGKSVSLPARTPIHAASYELRGGFLELTYANGATVLIEAPARFDLPDATLLRLHEGTLCAQVPEAAIGFTVETPSASVVDLGTEFGVSVNASNSEVHVFEGEVLVKTAGELDPLHLLENQASRIDLASLTPTGIEFQPEKFLRSLEETADRFAHQVRQMRPLAYYRMRTTSNGTVLKDVSSAPHDGKVVWGRSRGPWAPGKLGAALRIDGARSGTYALVPSLPTAMKGRLSVCAWVLAESRPRWASIAKNWVGNEEGAERGGQFHFGLWHDEGSLEVQVHDAQGRKVGVRESQPLPLEKWQFVAFTLDGGTLRLYRNGAEVAATPCAGLSTSAPSALGIGVKLDAAGREPEGDTPGFWSGRIDELAIFDRALTAAQIRKLHEVSAGTETTP